MIDRVLLRQLLGVATILLLVSAGATLAVGRSPALAGGLVLGFALGASPLVSWAWIVSRGLSSRRDRVIAALLMLAKLGLYSGALYIFVSRSRVSPLGVFLGLTGVVIFLCVGCVQGTSNRPREAA